MFKQKSFKLLFVLSAFVGCLTACSKEEVLAPNQPAGAENQTVIFIRAVNKDSSVVESSQLLLR